MTSRITVFLIFLLVLSASLGSTPHPEKIFAAEQTNDTFALTLTVTDKKGRPVAGLQRSDFTLLIDKQPAEIVSFSNNGPVSVGLLFDISGSMMTESSKETQKRWDKIGDGIVRFLERSHGQNEYFVIVFASTAKLIVDWTSDPRTIFAGLGQVTRGRETALYDALAMGMNKVKQGHRPKRALLVISDGQDNASKHKFTDVRDLLKRSDVLLYGVGLSDPASAGSSLGMEGEGIIDELTSASGTSALFLKFDNREVSLNDVFELLAAEMQSQYRAVVKVSSQGTPKWHKVSAKVEERTDSSGSKMRFVVKTRPGFYLN
ncbi:MAG TPA: VWA domain-containing protein [Pyrinomonadaceae bacterium]|jgi:Ca-activated chloride channel family protein|nr:VWA domain-containing protein [Pyrinomonadaceae bacterium]